MELYDYLWLPEDKQRVMHFRQKIPFGDAAAAERIACRTLPYLVSLGVTPEMTGYYVLCRAVVLYVLGGGKQSVSSVISPKIAVENELSETFIARSCEAALHYAWHHGQMSLSADHADADLLHFEEIPSPSLLVERLSQVILRRFGNEINK